MKKDFLTVTDLDREEIYRIFNLAKRYKSDRKNRQFSGILENRSIGLLFNKPSTRTRVSFEVAVKELGGSPLYLPGEATQITRGETVRDTAAVLSRYLDGMVIRTYKQEDVEEFAAHFSFPVINALTDLFHPCQIISDYFTIYEKKGGVEGLNVTYVGDGNNVCNSLILGADILGVNIRVASPEGYRPVEQVLKLVKNKKLLKISSDPLEFIPDSDVIYTDTWISMGDEKESENRKSVFKKYQVNRQLLSKAKKGFLLMHCLPAHRGWEVTDEVIDSNNSVVLDQAENRLHCQKALLHLLYS